MSGLFIDQRLAAKVILLVDFNLAYFFPFFLSPVIILFFEATAPESFILNASGHI
jgi:hypothetical protein